MSERRDTIIEPVAARKDAKIWNEEVEYSVEYKDDKSTIHSRDLGNYPDGVFLDSKQTFKPEYSVQQERFIIQKADGSLWTEDEILSIVDEAQLSYENAHPKSGDLIERVDLTDPDDPFLNHKYWEQRGEEGRLKIQGGAKFHAPITDMLRGNEEIGEGVGDSPTPGNVLYDLVDPEKKEQQETAKINSTLDAFEAFSKVRESEHEMLQVLTLLGENPEGDTLSMSSMQRILMEYVSDDKTFDMGISKQELAMKYMKLSQEDRKVYIAIRKNIERGIIEDNGGRYLYRGADLGGNLDDAFVSLRDPKNSANLKAILESASKL